MSDLQVRLPGDLAIVWAGSDVVVDAAQPHRRLQQITEAASYWLLLTRRDEAGAWSRIVTALDSLAEQQDTGTGLFLVGDNVLSPPDTSFTINGLARLELVLRERADGGPWSNVRDRLRAIIGAVAPALRAGGVHTPNHRWELAAALARSWAALGDDSLRRRAEQWLAEGVDVQPDGLYSERSPNYAAYVSNPSLTALGELLDRPDLLDVVHRNLHTQTLLTDGAGLVCTLQSRRQDQGRPFPAAPFEAGYRVTAERFGCAECAAMAAECAAQGGGDAVELAAELIRGAIPATLPPATPPRSRGWTDLTTSELAVHRDGATQLVVRAASDVAAVGRVCSGVNHEPTFAQFSAGEMRVGFRLSRGFFGLGPFRADGLEREGERVTLRERVAAGYCQPLEPSGVARDGSYALEFEGRFAAQMSFSRRTADLVELATTVTVERRPDGLHVTVGTDGPVVPMCLELALAADSSVVTGADHGVEPDLWVARGPVRIAAADGEAWVIVPLGAPLTSAAFYEPGEAVRYAGGSDAVTGPRVAVAWRSDTPLDLLIRRVASTG